MNRCCWILIAVLAGFAMAGCSESAPKPDARDQALKDPMNYNPAGNDWPDVSGGGILNYDRKAVGKDVDDVLSP